MSLHMRFATYNIEYISKHNPFYFLCSFFFCSSHFIWVLYVKHTWWDELWMNWNGSRFPIPISGSKFFVFFFSFLSHTVFCVVCFTFYMKVITFLSDFYDGESCMRWWYRHISGKWILCELNFFPKVSYMVFSGLKTM